MRTTALICLIASVVLAEPALCVAQVTIHRLEGPIATEYGVAVSGDGTTVVGTLASTGGQPHTAFRWTAESGVTPLGLVVQGVPSFANDVSGDGRIVVGHTNVGGFWWTEAAGIAGSSTLVIAISVDGNTVAGTQTGHRVVQSAIGTWQFGGEGIAVFKGIAGDGHSVVGGTVSPATLTATRWYDFLPNPFNSHSVELLGSLEPGTPSEARAASMDGSVIVGHSGSVANLGATRPFRWTVAGMEAIPLLPGMTAGVAHSVSGDGNTVVGIMQGAGCRRSFVWTPKTSTVDFRDYVAAFGGDVGGRSFYELLDVSTDGRTFVGTGDVRFTQAFRVVLPEQIQASVGACCQGTHCILVSTAGECGSRFFGPGTTCGFSENPTTCCPANFNGVGGISVQDIFDFLASYFSEVDSMSYASADFNRSCGVSIQDIFDFLAAYFAGCP